MQGEVINENGDKKNMIRIVMHALNCCLKDISLASSDGHFPMTGS